MRRPARSLLLAGLLTLAGVAAGVRPLAAQSSVPLRDRIMAVVGDDILLESEWREQVAVLAGQLGVAEGGQDYRDLAKQTFDQMLRDQIIVAAAKKDTAIHVPDDQVREEVEANIQRIRSRFPSEDAFLNELKNSQWGSLAAYRADLVDRKRHELLGQAYLDKHRAEIDPKPVTDEEVRAYWRENQASFGTRPVAYRFEEIPVSVTPDEKDREAARKKAEDVLAEIRNGRDFATAARQYSDDPGTAEKGGDLGWFGRGQMVPAFEKAAFEAPVGEIVGPVESPFGEHLLQVLDKRPPDEVHARHILIAYDLDDADQARARAEAERLRDLVAAGADVDSLQASHIESGDSAAAGVLEISRNQLPPAYSDALEKLEPGQAAVIQTPTGFSVLVSRGKTGGDPVTFEEIEPRLRQQLSQQKAEDAFVDRLRGQVYVDVRETPEQALTSR